MEYRKENNRIIVRLDRGEQVITGLERVCRQQSITGGFFFGVGAVDQATLGHYSVPNQKYTEKEFEQAFEVADISGSIGQKNDRLIIHAHATLADREFKTYSGHLASARISGTGEIIIFPAETIKKAHDTETGLDIFSFD